MKIAILAGGLGTRISEETDTKPKPMVLLDDKPIIWHLMNIFALQGFNEFVLALGYKSEVIKRWLVDLHELEGSFTVQLNKQKIEKIEKLNSEDWNAPQLFTLVHELAHIWIAETGISNEVEPELKHKSKFHPVELFCNEVAAIALMPNEIVLAFDSSSFLSSKEVFKVARQLGVSSFALLVRALNLNIISTPAYHKIKGQADIDYADYLKR